MANKDVKLANHIGRIDWNRIKNPEYGTDELIFLGSSLRISSKQITSGIKYGNLSKTEAGPGADRLKIDHSNTSFCTKLAGE